MTTLPTDLKYAETHEWVKQESDGLLRIGITDFAQHELGDLVFIELPPLGRKYAAQEQCAVVESVKTASDLFCPVAGEVVAVNLVVVDEPELVNQDAFGSWLFCIRPDNLADIQDLMSAAQYQQMVDE